MLLKSHTRRARGALRPAPHPALDPNTLPLPAGYTRTLHPGAPTPEVHPAPAPAPTSAPAYPPVSGVLATVECASGALVHLHRSGYDVLSPRGEYTVHAYAWRCTRCPRSGVGYLPQDGFARALTDARTHECEVHP